MEAFRGAAQAQDLSKASDSRAGGSALRSGVSTQGESGLFLREKWSGADDAHFSCEDVEELGELVPPKASEPEAEAERGGRRV